MQIKGTYEIHCVICGKKFRVWTRKKKLGGRSSGVRRWDNITCGRICSRVRSYQMRGIVKGGRLIDYERI